MLDPDRRAELIPRVERTLLAAVCVVLYRRGTQGDEIVLQRIELEVA